MRALLHFIVIIVLLPRRLAGFSVFNKIMPSPTPKRRFDVGDPIMCNCSEGWMLGCVVALDYREDEWPASQATAPYQVMLEESDRRLIYVPADDDRICRKPTEQDLNTIRRLDALALGASEDAAANSQRNPNLTAEVIGDGITGYRDGRCECCDSCPRAWTAVELYSEHYRAAARNGLPVVRRTVDLGTVEAGTFLRHAPDPGLPSAGFLQCPTLPRLPPGVVFGDDGSLSGTVKFDPHRGDSYKVEFVAVSTVDWEFAGLVRLEIQFEVVENFPPASFDKGKFEREQNMLCKRAERILQVIYETWGGWESGTLDQPETVKRMTRALHRLRNLLEQHPMLDSGLWWAQLGGYHMNVHKLLENKLFECELYLGQALLLPNAQVRRSAEQNLDGCYSKRQLETARYLWYDGLDLMIKGEYAKAIEVFVVAAGKKEGWGWGVNHGDIWISEAAARLLRGVDLTEKGDSHEGQEQIDKVSELLDQAKERWNMGGDEHPWAKDLRQALSAYRLQSGNLRPWIVTFKKETIPWCAAALQGVYPFPPKPKPRTDDAEELRRRMPGHHK